MSTNQFVGFKVGGGDYGIDIMDVKEISEFKTFTKIPKLPSFIEGVINLRGEVIPVINLKKIFNLSETTIEENSKIIITSLDEKLVGFIVDDASSVMTLADSDIDIPPDLINGNQAKFIIGIAKVAEKIIILLDLSAIFSTKERDVIAEIELN